MNELGLQLSTDPQVLAIPYFYGKLSFWAVGLPVVGPIVRAHHVSAFQRFVMKKCKENPEALPDAIGHSLGSYLIFESMRAEDAPRAFYRRVCLMAAPVSSREDFEDVQGHFWEMLNLWSDADEVVRWNPFGHAGWKGFLHATAYNRVRNLDMTPYKHRNYTEPGRAWDVAAGFLKSG